MRTIKPLEVTHFYVLLALAYEPLHGYAIHDRVRTDSHSAVYFSYPALYALVHNLERQKLVQVVAGSSPTRGPARTTYALTLKGRRLLKVTGHELWRAGQLARERVA